MDAKAAAAALDQALANGGKVKITFGPKAGGNIKSLLDLEGISIPFIEERVLRQNADAGDTSCDIVVQLTDSFPKSRLNFEKRVLKGVTALAPVT